MTAIKVNGEYTIQKDEVVNMSIEQEINQKVKEGELSDNEIEQVLGGYAGRDKYEVEDYLTAGISHEHNIFEKDRYLYNGTPITQEEAENVCETKLKRGA